MTLSSRFMRTAVGIASAVCAAAGMMLVSPTQASAIAASNIPAIGADVGRFVLPISCQISIANINLISIPLTVDIKGVAPATLGPGQQFYLSEGSGALTIPSWITSLTPLLGIKTADATVNAMTIGATNATPAQINIAATPIQINNIAITAGQPLVVGLPKVGTFTVGPYTAPSSGRVTLKFAGANVAVKLNSSAGFSIPLNVNCAGGTANGLLTMEVGGASGQAPANYTNAPIDYLPSVTAGNLVGTITSPYTCNFGGNALNVGIAVNGQLPLSVSKSSTLSITQGTGALVIPAAQVDTLLSQGIKSISGNADVVTLVSENASPVSENVLPAGGIAIPATTLVKDTPVVVPLPSTGSLAPGAFTPNSGASTLTVELGTVVARLYLNGSTTATVATCAQPSPNVILGEFPITS